MKCIGLPGKFVPSGGVQELHQRLGLDDESIAMNIRQFLGLLRVVPEVASK